MTQDAVPDLSDAALDALELRLQMSGPIGIAPLDAIRALRAQVADQAREIARLTHELEQGFVYVCAEPAIKHFKERAEQERDALRADAERYRWLRNSKSSVDAIFTDTEYEDRYAHVEALRLSDDLDSAIDAARQAGKP